MDNERDNARRLPEQLQRDLEALAARHGSGRHSDDPYATELEYHLTRLGSALHAIRVGHHTFELYSHRDSAELLAQIDTVLAQTAQIQEMAERAREVLLRPPPEDGEPGFAR